MSRAWSLAVPVVTVLVVAYALFVAGAPRKTLGERIYGGPTEGVTELSLRVESVARDGERESAGWDGPITVSGAANGVDFLTTSTALGAAGVIDVPLRFEKPVAGPVRLYSRASNGELARGEISLTVERWAQRARRRGGWIRGRDTNGNGLVISIAPERGAFVVGASDPLLIRVERAGDPLANAQLTLKAEGARLESEPGLHTDALGRARVGFEALELNPTLSVEARADDGQTGLIDSGVPVVPGGLHGIATATGIRVASATPRTQAFFSVVTDRARIAGGTLSLKPDGQGGSFADAALHLPVPLPVPSWLVVSTEVDENSAAAIGWPLQASVEPAQTFDVPDVLLLDGVPAAFEREQARLSRVRWLTAAFIASAFLLSVALLVLRVRAADRDIARHLRTDLESETAARIAPRTLWPLVVALLAIGLGFVVFIGIVFAAR
ncbi:MAG TPA: hypothetical protein VGF76_13070 [Polyangiaceae bacterium]